VAQALIHEPALLILDEPINGLDPLQIVEMRALIRNLKGSHTVLLSTHILSEISQTCDRLLVIQDGALVAQGTEEELVGRVGSGDAIELEIQGEANAALEAIRAVPGVRSVNVLRSEAGSSGLRVEAPAALRPEIVIALVTARVPVLRVDKATGGLESMFLKLSRRGPG
jgi:ABC-2 type transport system ATP-binding protein